MSNYELGPFEKEKYQGKFYQIHRQNPPVFQNGCEGVTTEYKSGEGGTIEILTSCYSRAGTGRPYTAREPRLREVRSLTGLLTPKRDAFDTGDYILTYETSQRTPYNIYYTDYNKGSVGGNVE